MEHSTAFSPFAAIVGQGLERLHGLSSDPAFTFVINGEPVETPLSEAVMLSPFAYEVLQGDRSCHEFVISSEAASVDGFSRLRRIAGGTEVTVEESAWHSVMALSRALGNRSLELATLALFLESLSGTASFMPSPLMGRVPLEEICALSFDQCVSNDLVTLDVSTLDGILSNESLVINSEDWLLSTLLDLAARDSGYTPLLRHVRFGFVAPSYVRRFLDEVAFADLTLEIWECLSPRLIAPCRAMVSRASHSLRVSIDSLIAPELSLEPFPEFRGKHFNPLYRLTRDGSAARFHEQCDGHAETFVLFADRNGSIYGGYTPVPWASSGGETPDPAGQTFLFTLTNSFRTAPLRFPLRRDARNAIVCDADLGPTFVWGQVYDWGSFDGPGLDNLPGGFFQGGLIDVLSGLGGPSSAEIEVFEIKE
jgi:hypothetical protein